MKAIVLKAPGGVENLFIQDIDKPAIKSGEVLIQTKAISINPVDVKSRSGKGNLISSSIPLEAIT
ncbi:hypothetical protein ACFOET_02765 [Parapedobacter deserti]|uniref:Uncharacterized protein n=1 Tax=Parapedobacter deserti TaxID=1912957 RepID=A0ABV7JI41_9SPHI